MERGGRVSADRGECTGNNNKCIKDGDCPMSSDPRTTLVERGGNVGVPDCWSGGRR